MNQKKLRIWALFIQCINIANLNHTQEIFQSIILQKWLKKLEIRISYIFLMKWSYYVFDGNHYQEFSC